MTMTALFSVAGEQNQILYYLYVINKKNWLSEPAWTPMTVLMF